jgi:hypothetical protein
LVTPKVCPEVIDDPRLGWIVDGTLVFRGVYMSTRIIREYMGDPENPKWFTKGEIIYDVANIHDGKNKRKYEFEGSLDSPPAWVGEWVVLADSFELQIL